MIDADMRTFYRINQKEHGYVTSFGTDKSKDRKSLGANTSHVQKWLDETPKEEPWTSTSYYARDSQKDSK